MNLLGLNKIAIQIVLLRIHHNVVVTPHLCLYCQVDKVIQLYETVMTRHTTMVVGQTGGGKTVILNTIARSQTKLGKKTTLFTINPKVGSNAICV